MRLVRARAGAHLPPPPPPLSRPATTAATVITTATAVAGTGCRPNARRRWQGRAGHGQGYVHMQIPPVTRMPLAVPLGPGPRAPAGPRHFNLRFLSLPGGLGTRNQSL
jgi:hypothetical protein